MKRRSTHVISQPRSLRKRDENDLVHCFQRSFLYSDIIPSRKLTNGKITRFLKGLGGSGRSILPLAGTASAALIGAAVVLLKTSGINEAIPVGWGTKCYCIDCIGFHLQFYHSFLCYFSYFDVSIIDLRAKFFHLYYS